MAYPPGAGLEAVPARIYPLPSGDLGTWITVWVMQRVTRRALENPTVLSVARSLAAATLDPRERAQQIRTFLSTRSRFVPDPLDQETIRTPYDQLLEAERTGTITGDCDDVAVLGAALGLAVGLPARFVVLGFFRPDAPYGHVYAELEVSRGQWVDLDVTRPAQGLPPIVTRRLVWDV